MSRFDVLGSSFLDLFEKGSAPSLEEEFIDIEEAVYWVAFGQYSWPGLGPKPISEWAYSEDYWTTTFNRFDGRRDLASELLMAAIATSDVQLIGIVAEWDAEELASAIHDDKRDIVMHWRMFFVPVELKSQMRPKRNDKDYSVGDFWFSDLLVNRNWLEQRFPDRPSGVSLPAEQQVGSLEAIQTAAIEHSIQNSDDGLGGHSPRRRGRPRQWDWDDILTEIVKIANAPDGLPATPAELQRMVASYCNRKWGKEPATSSLSEKIGLIYRKLDGKLR